MKKLVLAGDSLMHGPGGYASLLESMLLYSCPQTQYLFESVKQHCENVEAFLEHGIPIVLGRAPSLIYLGTGFNGMDAPHSSQYLLEKTEEALSTLKRKSDAQIFISNWVSEFYRGNSYLHQRCLDFNGGLKQICEELKIQLIDIDSPAGEFLQSHRSGKGEKRALHREGPNLLPMGAYLISSIVANSLIPEIGL